SWPGRTDARTRGTSARSGSSRSGPRCGRRMVCWCAGPQACRRRRWRSRTRRVERSWRGRTIGARTATSTSSTSISIWARRSGTRTGIPCASSWGTRSSRPPVPMGRAVPWWRGRMRGRRRRASTSTRNAWSRRSGRSSGPRAAWRCARRPAIRWRRRSPRTRWAAPWCRGSTRAPRRTGPTSTPRNYRTFHQVDFYWSAVGVRGSGGDWDLEMYDTDSYGLQPYPTCFGLPMAGSYSTSQVDFIVEDSNDNITPPGIYGVRAYRYSGTGNALLEWDGGTSELFPNTAGVGSNVAGWTGLLDTYDINLTAGVEYYFKLTTNNPSAQVKVFLFTSL